MSKSTSRRSASSAASVQVVPQMVVLALMVLMLSQPVLSWWCPKMGQSCGPDYPCCECDSVNGGRKLYCDYQGGQKPVCRTYASEPTCDSGRKCSAGGECAFNSGSALEERVREVLGLPRKMSKLGR